MESDRKEAEYKPKRGTASVLSEEHTLPKTTPARTAIRTGKESSSDHAGPDRVGPSEITCFWLELPNRRGLP
jgi:hypothetical protein